jgi:uncharacterized protein YdaU (DUF1376 family)
MPTQKHRISISPDEALYAALSVLSKRRKRAVSAVALDLVTKAIELEEDLHFSRVADERLAAKEKLVDHERAWR